MGKAYEFEVQLSTENFEETRRMISVANKGVDTFKEMLSYLLVLADMIRGLGIRPLNVFAGTIDNIRKNAYDVIDFAESERYQTQFEWRAALIGGAIRATRMELVKEVVGMSPEAVFECFAIEEDKIDNVKVTFDRVYEMMSDIIDVLDELKEQLV